MNKKHLLLLSPGFAENEADSRCIPALQLFVEELNRRKQFHLTIISLHYPYEAVNYSWKGIQVYALGGNNKKSFRRIVLFQKAIQLANKVHREIPVDHIHSFWLGQCAWIGNKLAAKWEKPHSCTLMGQDVLKTNAYVRKIKPLPQLIALSDFHINMLQQELNIKAAEKIPWGVKRNKDLNAFEKPVDVLGVGNLTELKSFHRFINILAVLKPQHPNLKAVLVGEGEQRELKALIKKHDLGENVELAGIKQREEVLDLMQQSKCLLHCSNFESFGMVIVEALSSGAAVFSTAVGIAPEIAEVNLFKSEEEAAKQMEAFFKSEKEIKPTIPFDIVTTVDSYLNSVF